MSLAPIERMILEIATEDYHGLWEARSLVEANTREAGDAAAKATADALRRLIERGLVQLFKADFPDWNSAKILSPEEERDIIADVSSFDPPLSEKGQILVGATDKGNRVYLSNAQPPLPEREHASERSGAA